MNEAIKRHLQALKIKEKKMPNSITLGKSYLNVSNILREIGRLKEAKTLLSRAEAIAVKTKNYTLILEVLVGKGLQQGKEGDLSGAIDLLKSAIAAEEKRVGSTLMLAKIHEALAVFLEESGQLAEARASRTRALTIRHSKVPQSLEIKTK